MPPPPSGFTLVENEAPSGANSVDAKPPKGFSLTNETLPADKLSQIKTKAPQQKASVPKGFSLVDPKQDPLIASRVSTYQNAIKNGFTPQIAAKTSVAESVGMAPDPSNWRKITSAIGRIPTGTGKTFGDVGDAASEVLHRAWANPMGISDERWEKAQKEMGDYLTKINESHLGSGALGKFASGMDTGAAKFAGEQLAPGQIALMVGTFGESALIRAGAKLGIPAAPAVAKTVSKLMQIQFASSMVEGAASGANETIDAIKRGDWQAAGQSAVEGLVSGFMAHGLIGHEVASEKVHRDLDDTAQKKHGAHFSQLNPYDQGLVIHETVEKSPEYKAVTDKVETENAKTQRKAEQRLTDYHDRAIEQSWEPNVARRTIEAIDQARDLDSKKSVSDGLEATRQHYLKQIVSNLKTATEQRQVLANEQQQEEEQARQEGREGRPQRKAGEREKKAVVFSNAKQTEDARGAAADLRTKADAEWERDANSTYRPVNAEQSDDGHVAYQANYYGETNSFGLAGDVDHLGVYRETPRGVEYLNKYGLYSDNPTDVYIAPDAETGNTVAQISALRHEAESGGNFKEESYLSDLQREVISGDKKASDARKEAGLKDKAELPSEVDALRAGDLKGPLAETTQKDFLDQLNQMAEDLGMSEEKRTALQSQAGVAARMETENNLHHVARSGDYVTSKKGVRWTLDSQGFLHPEDGGAPVPLLKNGRYSSQAIDLAKSGKVGYGGRTREQRRADTAKQRAIQAKVQDVKAIINKAVTDALSTANKNKGLEAATTSEPSANESAKQERRKKFGPAPEPDEYDQRGAATNLDLYSRSQEIADQVERALTQSGAEGILNSIAQANGVTRDEVIRQSLATDDSPEGISASLEAGDQITDKFRPDHPWNVVQRPDAKFELQSRGARIQVDRMNPSSRVLDLIKSGEVRQNRPYSSDEMEAAAYGSPHVIYRDSLVEQVRAIQNGEQIPEPTTPAQAQGQAEAAEKRTEAALSKATETQAEAIDPSPGTTLEEADRKVDEATQDAQTAEAAYAQEAEIKSKTTAPSPFPPRAPVSIGLRGNAGVIKQNGRELPMHYEVVPLASLVTSHEWQGNMQVPNPEYPSELQPRTISEQEAKQNAMRAMPRATDAHSMTTGYDFDEYSDRTINGAMGPAIIEAGGRVVGGNTRIGIMRKHLDMLRSITDETEREVALGLFRNQMRNLARENGIEMPLSDNDMAVVRVMDEPISDMRQAADLGRLLNKSISVEMTASAQGVSFSKSLTNDNLATIGRLIEDHDGLSAALDANNDYFKKLVTDNFGIVPSEYAGWFDNDSAKGLVLSERGRQRFSKALLGTIFKDSSILNSIEGTVPYRALERSLPYLIKMRAVDDRNITNKIIEAVTASASTQDVDAGLSRTSDKWGATYKPDQMDFLGMETNIPPEPDRIVETLWRAMHGSNVSAPRIFNDRLKNWLGDESGRTDSMFAVHETPAEVFNRVFSKELREVAFTRGDKTPGISQSEFDAMLRNAPEGVVETTTEGDHGATEQAGAKEEKSEAPVPKGGLTPPPEPGNKPVTPELKLEFAKEEKGYVTSGELKDFLTGHEATKDHVPEIMRTAQMMAEYVFDADPPAGLERKDALDWVLKERVSKLEAGKGKGRGSYSDPLIEKGLGTGILRLSKAADETSFIHEFAHVIFPMLSQEDLRDLNTIHDTKIPGWDQSKPLKGEDYKGLSEKFARGLEKFLRDENPTGFTAEVKKVLAKVKEIFKQAYLRFAGDPLNTFELSEEAKGVFANMFGVTDFDVANRWSEEVKKARSEGKGLTRPDKEPHPIVKTAKELGAQGIRSSFAGKIEESAGDRVDPKKPTVVYFYPNAETAMAAWLDVGTPESKVQDAELIAGGDGTYGIRTNTPTKVPNDLLYQEVPRKHPGIELEELKSKLAKTPASLPVLRKAYEQKIQNLENEIRSKYGAEERKPVEMKETAKAAVQEKKNVSTGKQTVPDVRRLPERPVGDIQRRGLGPVPKFTLLGGKNDAAVRGAGGPLPGTRQLTAVRPVALEPQPDRGQPVGILQGQKYDQQAWLDGLKKSGLPQNMPPPTVTISAETAQVLKYAGQKQIVQSAMSALEQGDGFVVASATGSGKTYTAGGIVKEFMNANPAAKILYITKNRGLLDGGDKSFKRVAKTSFGVEMEANVPRGTIGKGVYGTTYQRLLGNDIYKKTDWDLVVADESGEMRNWFREDSKQGTEAIAVIDKSKKAVYVSATPFHSPAEYGYAKKLNLWPKNGFDQWIKENFDYADVGGKVVAKLDPGKQAKLRQQLIERGQFVSQMISYDGFTTHFGVVPIGDDTRIALNRIHEGISRAKAHLIESEKKGTAARLSAFEAIYTKSFLERSRLPQAIDLVQKGLNAGWHPLVFSEWTAEDLFRREIEGKPSAYQELDQEMGGELSRIMPPFPNVYEELKKALGNKIGDYSGSGNTDAARESAKNGYMDGSIQSLYTTYAAGGIGISLHDEVGDKPRLAIFLGPPYSGVLLEQAMGRPWRFGVKSNVHAVFLATDSEPDINLMATKIGPRTRAVRASVLGERDSLGTVMGNYTDEEKTRERQDMLAYDQGNEVKVDAQSFQRRDKRNVQIDNWSAIQIPNADTAKHKGMQVAIAGKDGDWATLYQPNPRKASFNRPPPTFEEMVARRKLNDTAEVIANGTGLPPGDPMEKMEPSDRQTAAGAAAAVGASAQDVPVGRDKGNAGKMAAEAMYRLGWKLDDDGVWRKIDGPVERTPNGPPQETGPEDVRTDWGLLKAWTMSSETAIRSIAEQAGNLEAGRELVRMQRNYVQMIEKHYADYANEMGRIAVDNGNLDFGDEKVMRELWSVVEGKSVSKDGNINKAANEISDLMEIVHGDMASADVKLKTPKGETISYKKIQPDRAYMPHRIDWDAQIEDPETKDVATLKEIMGKTFSQAKRDRMLQQMAAEMGVSPAEVADYLNKMKTTPPVFGHIQRARSIDFPIYKQDLPTMMRYFEQASGAIAREKVFGDSQSKLNAAMSKIPSENGRRTIGDMFEQNWRQQDWNSSYGKIYNKLAAIEIFTKMNWSAIKVPFHLANVPLALGGRVMPITKAVIESIANRKEFKENTAMAGTIIRQVNPLLLMDEGATTGAAHWILKKEGFEAAYRWGRAIAGSTARVYMEQYAMDALKRGGPDAEEAKRILKDRMLTTDTQIDEAIRKGSFSNEALQTAQRAFANLTMFSERNPLQMPLLARLDTSANMNSGTANLNRAVRMTYLLQSFAVKFHSLAKETVYDEVVKNKNYKPLAYLVLASPILGQMLKGAAAAVPSGVHRGITQGTALVTGQPETHQKDSWDRYLDQFKALYGDHPAIAAMKIYIDGMCAQTALEMLRLVADPMMDAAGGNRKKAGAEFEYLKGDIEQSAIGPGWTSMTLNMIDLVTSEFRAAFLSKADHTWPNEKKAFVRWLENEVPSVRLIPGMETPGKKPASGSLVAPPAF